MRKIIALLVALVLCGCSANDAVTTGSDYSRIENKGYGWGLKKIQNSAPEVPKYICDMLNEHNGVYMGNPEEKKIYLTFDEGYENGYTVKILDTLKEKNVPAAFFVTGDYLERSEELVERMVLEGHIVGNHTIGHKNLHKLSSAEDISAEISALEEKFKAKFDAPMKYMRPPEGEYSRRVLAVAEDMGYKTVFWSFAYKDWIANDVKGGDYAVGQIMPYLHNGMIILLHAVSPDNAEALPIIIDKAREMGYEFASLDEL